MGDSGNLLLLIEAGTGRKSVIYAQKSVKIGDIEMLEDGFWYFWPELRPGAWCAEVLKELGEKIIELNIPWERELVEYFGDKETVVSEEIERRVVTPEQLKRWVEIDKKSDPFTPTAVDLDDIWDDEELEGIVACDKDDPECESCS